jgi:hypothetical protein
MDTCAVSGRGGSWIHECLFVTESGRGGKSPLKARESTPWNPVPPVVKDFDLQHAE